MTYDLRAVVQLEDPMFPLGIQSSDSLVSCRLKPESSSHARAFVHLVGWKEYYALSLLEA